MAEPAASVVQRWQLITLAGCQLAIGRYPRFTYNASGGGGISASSGVVDPGDTTPLRFDADQLRIPPLTWRTTRVLGLPLPPGLSITIVPEFLHGAFDPADQRIRLQFRARFRFRLAAGDVCLYAAPDLLVDTTLQSGACQGQRHRAIGRPRGGDGAACLVGIARVAPTGDAWLDRFLGLPDEALAKLHCRLIPQP
jgi:hypothetical protein